MHTAVWTGPLARAAAVALAIVMPVHARLDGLLLGAAKPAVAQSTGSSAEKEAFEASKALGTVEAWQAYLKNFPTGFLADLARAYLSKLQGGTPRGDATTPAQPAPVAISETVTLAATAIRVGKWPERAGFDGKSLWVSESGNRSIVEIDLQTRRVARRQKVGRLPVDMVVTENQTVYALSRTDNMIYAVAPGGRDTAGQFAQVPRCAELMTYAADVLWVVSNLNCSAPGVLTRVSHLNGRTSKVADLAGGGTDIKVAGGHIHVGHMSNGGRAAFLSVVDAGTGSISVLRDLPMHFPKLATNGDSVFVGGAPLDQNTGVVLKVAPGRTAITAQRRLPEPLVALDATQDYVIAAGRNGTIFVLTVGDLGLVRTITTSASIKANDVVAIGNMLAVVSSAGNEVASDNNVYLIDGWIPGSVAGAGFVPAPVERPQQAKPVSGSPRKPACAENYRLVNGECTVIQNCGANAFRSHEGDCSCNENFVMQNGRCVFRQVQRQRRVIDNCPGDSVLKNGQCVKDEVPEPKAPIACFGGQLYSLSQQKCACQDGLKWNGQRCTL